MPTLFRIKYAVYFYIPTLLPLTNLYTGCFFFGLISGNKGNKLINSHLFERICRGDRGWLAQVLVGALQITPLFEV